MSEPIEIKNVMGARGVASEATLLLLLDAFKNQNTGTSRTSSQRVQELYDRSVSESTKQTGLFLKSLVGAASSVWDTSKAFATGARRTEEFAEALAGGPGKLSRLFGMVDDTVDSFRSLSSVGASFNNSMFDMIKASANSAMELGDFNTFVKNNSEVMRLLGGSVTQGAMAMGEFSKQLRSSDAGYRLLEMGFTIDDLNEGLVDYLDLTFRQGRQDTLRTQNLSVVTAEYLKDLDALAKVTGKSREEFMNLSKQLASDGRIRAIQSRASQTGADNLTKNLSVATALFPQLGESIINLQSGMIAGDDMAQALLAGTGNAGREFASLIQNMGNMTEDEFITKMSEAGPALADYLKSMDPATLAFYKMQGGITGAIASLADMGHQLDKSSMMDYKAALDEQNRTATLTGIFANFENAIIRVRRSIVDMFVDSALAESLGEFGEKLSDMVSGTGSDSLSWLMKKLGDAFNYLAGDDGILTIVVRWMTRELKPGGKLDQAFQTLKVKFDELAIRLGTWWDQFTSNIESQGFWGAIKTEFTNLFSSIKQQLLGGPDLEIKQDLEKQLADAQAELANALDLGDTAGIFIAKAKIEDLEKNLSELSETKGLFQTLSDKFKDYVFGDQADSTASIGELAGNYFKDLFSKIKSQMLGGPDLEIKQDLEKQLADAQAELASAMDVGDTAGIFIAKSKIEDLENELSNLPETEGFLKKMIDGLISMWDRIDTSPLTDRISNYFETLVNKIKQNILGGPDLSVKQGLEDQLSRAKEELASSMDIGDSSGITDAKNKIAELEKNLSKLPQTDSLLEKLTNSLSDLFNKQEVIDALTNSISKVFDSVVNGFSDFWNSDKANDMQNIIVGFFDEIQLRILEILDSIPFVNTLEKQGEVQLRQGDTSGLGGAVAADQLAEMFESRFWQRSKTHHDLGKELGTAVQEAFKQTSIGRAYGTDIETGLTQLARKARDAGRGGTALSSEDQEFLRLAYDAMKAKEQAEINSNALGTNGFQDFGSKTYATLHGVEAVVPKNSPAGEILDKVFDIMNTNTSTAPSTDQQSMPNQSNLANKIDELNTTMLRVALLLESSVGVQTKTMQGVRGLNSDFYRSVGR